MSWAAAWLLGLLPLVPLAALGHILLLRHIRQRQAGLGMRTHREAHAGGRFALRLGLIYTGLALLLISLAGPRWGASQETRRDRGANLIVLLDCSRSMLAEDLSPNRLVVAKRKIEALVTANPNHRVALLPFAGRATLRCPLTSDHQAFIDMLGDSGPDLFPADWGYQGTAIGEAVERALALLRPDDRGQALIIASDGSDPDQERVQAAAEAAAEEGVPIYGLFLGDPEREVSLSIDGRQVVMAADRSSLDLLAQVSHPTAGISVNASLDDTDVQQIGANIDAHIRQAPWERRRQVVASERYFWVLLPAIACLAIGHLLPTRRRRGQA